MTEKNGDSTVSKAAVATTTIEDLYKAFGELADAKENAGKVNNRKIFF